jgi:hypothetical protein
VFNVFGHEYSFAPFCDTLDAYALQMQALSRVGWITLALFIVLSA